MGLRREPEEIDFFARISFPVFLISCCFFSRRSRRGKKMINAGPIVAERLVMMACRTDLLLNGNAPDSLPFPSPAETRDSRNTLSKQSASIANGLCN